LQQRTQEEAEVDTSHVAVQTQMRTKEVVVVVANDHDDDHEE